MENGMQKMKENLRYNDDGKNISKQKLWVSNRFCVQVSFIFCIAADGAQYIPIPCSINLRFKRNIL